MIYDTVTKVKCMSIDNRMPVYLVTTSSLRKREDSTLSWRTAKCNSYLKFQTFNPTPLSVSLWTLCAVFCVAVSSSAPAIVFRQWQFSDICLAQTSLCIWTTLPDAVAFILSNSAHNNIASAWYSHLSCCTWVSYPESTPFGGNSGKTSNS